MKMKKTSFITTLIMAFVLSCTTTFAQSSETRNLSGFTKVNYSGVGNLNIHIGSEFKVVLEGDAERIAETETKVSNGKLIIREKKMRNRFGNNRTSDTKIVTANITMPTITDLSVSGIANAEVFDSFTSESLNLRVRGISKLILNDVSGKYLNSKVSGISHITIQGNGSFDKANIRARGISSYTGEYLKIETAKVKLSGITKCNIYVSSKLNAKISGKCKNGLDDKTRRKCGSIIYGGSPKINAAKSSLEKISPK
jgi:hypothetical protein